MHAIPVYFSRGELKKQKDFTNKLCHYDASDAAPSDDWVKCPLVDNNPISLGCCIDFQSAARAKDFENYALRYLIEEFSKKSKRSKEFVRVKCLKHQLQILSDPDYEVIDKKGLKDLIDEIKNLMNSLASDSS